MERGVSDKLDGLEAYETGPKRRVAARLGGRGEDVDDNGRGGDRSSGGGGSNGGGGPVVDKIVRHAHHLLELATDVLGAHRISMHGN